MPHQMSLFDEFNSPEQSSDPSESTAAAPPSSTEASNAPLEAVLDDEARIRMLSLLQSRAVECSRCGLASTRTRVVFGEGNPLAPLVLVGEGPGENEDATGRPFVGRAGKLLDEVLRENGMTRNHVYICNTVKCRAFTMENGRAINRPPTADEIGACRNWLQEQLELIRPTVVVCLGAPAANTIIHKGFRMTAERGRWFTSSCFASWTMAAFHPAYVLRLHGAGYDAARETLSADIGNARRKVIEVRRAAREAVAPRPSPRTLFE